MTISHNSITCPNCSFQFEATSVLTAQIKQQLESEFASKSKQQEADLLKKKQELEQQQKQLEFERHQTEALIQAKVKESEEKAKAEMNKKWLEMQSELRQKLETESRAKVDLEIKDLQAQNQENQRRLSEAQNKELELRKQARELEEKSRQMDLEMQRKLDEERKNLTAALTERIQTELSESLRLKMAEKDKQIEQMQRSLEDAQRKANQGSMQIQGDVQENDLKEILVRSFPFDTIEDVATGIRGADLIQKVCTNFGQQCGTILWESKRTKTWSDDWVKKLKDDQMSSGADVAILTSQVLPDDIKSFGKYKGIWVVQYNTAYILSVTGIIRHYVQEIHSVKNSLVGREEKMQYLYNYLSGTQFKTKVENIVSGFTSMKEDLESEKRAMMRIWAKRDKEITRVIESTIGMYGDLQGIIGGELETIPALELPGEDNGELF